MEIIFSMFAEFNKNRYIRLSLLKNRLLIEIFYIQYLAILTFLFGGVLASICYSLLITFGGNYINNISIFNIYFPLICIAFISYLLMLIFRQTHRYKKMSFLLYIGGYILSRDWNKISQNARIFSLVLSITIPVVLGAIIFLMIIILHNKDAVITYLAPIAIIVGLIWAKFIAKLLEWKSKSYFSSLVFGFFTIVIFFVITLFCIKREESNIYSNVLTAYGYYEYLKNYKNELLIYFQKSYPHYKCQLFKDLFFNYRIERKYLINGRKTFNDYSQRERIKFFLILGLLAAFMVMMFYFISNVM